jgi:hypothetical protein
MKKFAPWLFVFWVLLLLLQLSAHKMWADELQFWLIIKASPNLGKLFSILHYEGHPSLWYLIIWTLQKIWDNLIVLKIAHALVGTLNLFIIAKLSPFTRTQKILLCFGYLFSFEYFIISRSYAIGATFLLLYFWLSDRHSKKLYLQSLCLGLAVNTSLFAAFAAVFFFADMLLEKIRKKESLATLLGPSLVFAALSILAALSMYPAADVDPHFAATIPDLHNLPGIFYTLSTLLNNSFAPVPDMIPNFWNSSALRAIEQPFASVIFVFLYAPLAYLLYKNRRKAPLFLLTLLFVFIFCRYKHFGYIRHHAFIFMVFLGYLWHGPFKENKSTANFKNSMACVNFYFILQAFAALSAHLQALAYPFSSFEKTAKFLKETKLNETATLATFPDFPMNSISAYLDQPLYRIQSHDYGTYVEWSQKRKVVMSAKEIESVLKSIRRPDKDTLLITVAEDYSRAHNSPWDFQLRDFQLKPIFRSRDCAWIDNCVDIYRVSWLKPIPFFREPARIKQPPDYSIWLYGIE